MIEREALQFALETLEIWKGYMPALWDKTDEQAITAIKKALAQPEQEPVTLPENKKLILVDSSFDDLMYWLERCESKGHLENCSDLIEPWEKFCDSNCVWTDHHPDCKLAERLPLTLDELWRVFTRSGLSEFHQRDSVVEYKYQKCIEEFARAIEAAVWEKQK